jgi:para-aminobenzoate synthetase component 1
MSAQFHSTLLSVDINTRQLFRYFSHMPWAMLLDSGQSHHVDAKFDIIVHTPIVTLTSDDNETTITHCDNQHVIVSSDNPFDLLTQQLNCLSLDTTPSELAFSGGAVGLFSYDLGRHCETLNTIAVKDIDVPVMAVGIYRHAIIFDHVLGQFFVVSRANLQSHHEYIESLTTVMAQPLPTRGFKGSEHWHHQISKNEYADKFFNVKNHLRQGNCYQINLTQRFEMDYSGNEYSAYLTLANKNETPFSGFIRLDDCAIMSLSPERFLQTKQDNIQTKPIKGTIARSKDTAEDKALAAQLRASEKDQSENLMIVDLLRNDIGRNAVAGSVYVPMLFDIESFENVHHLVSTVTAKLPPNVSPIQLLRDAFPGGSITGAPKISAMNIIDTLEPNRRSIYCGSMGYISADGNMDTSITIRTLLATQGQLYAWAGGGIVADSTLDAEYKECFDKLASIMPVLCALNIED